MNAAKPENTYVTLVHSQSLELSIIIKTSEEAFIINYKHY